MRGLWNGGVIAVALWLAVLAGVLWSPATAEEWVAYLITASLGVVSLSSLFLVPKPSRPDRYELVFPPLDGDAQDRYDRGH